MKEHPSNIRIVMHTILENVLTTNQFGSSTLNMDMEKWKKVKPWDSISIPVMILPTIIDVR